MRFPLEKLLLAKNMIGDDIQPAKANGGVAVVAISEADGPVYLRLRA